MKHSKKFSEYFILFIKGIFMGSADIIPGVSGGTIALITGIYERFVAALKSINVSFLIYFLKGFIDNKSFKKSKERFFSIDFAFLIPLVFGIIVAFISLANVVGFCFDSFPTYTFAFFFGLIFASSIHIYFLHRLLFKKWFFIVFLFIGLIVSYIIVGSASMQMEHSLLIIFFAGVISLCAMILPGLSGAFILLMLGQYTFMLDVLRELTHFNFDSLGYAISYGIGGIVGLLVFSRIISYFFKKYRTQTLSFVLGLMIGALRKPGEFILQNQENNLITGMSLFIGIAIVVLFSYYEFLLKKSLIKKKTP